MISRINIKSYRGIDSLELNNLQQINLLTGDNNSGKTSVLEIISTFGQPDILRSWYHVSRADNQIEGVSLYERMNDLFCINAEEKKITYTIEEEEECTKVELVAEDSECEMTEKKYLEQMNYSVSGKKYRELDEKVILILKTKFDIRVNGERKESFDILEGQRRLPFTLKKSDKSYVKKVVYISPFEHVNGTLFLNDILNNPQLYEEMLQILKEFDAGILSINYDDGGTARRGGFYKILSKENNKALPLTMYGDGMKKAILLMSAVVKAKDGILLLDEFETAIHTSAMDKVFKWILETCLKLNVQVFMTSHSKEAINKVLHCSEELREHMALYTLYKDEEGNSVRRLDAEKAIDAAENMGLELR